MKTQQIAVRLDDDEIARVDALVRSGRYPNRAEVVRAGIAALAAEEIDAEIVAACTKQPQAAWELKLANASARTAIAAEPW